MNSLFSDFFREFWRGILGGGSGLFRGYVGRLLVDKNKDEIRGKEQDNYTGTNPEQIQTNLLKQY